MIKKKLKTEKLFKYISDNMDASFLDFLAVDTEPKINVYTKEDKYDFGFNCRLDKYYLEMRNDIGDREHFSIDKEFYHEVLNLCLSRKSHEHLSKVFTEFIDELCD